MKMEDNTPTGKPNDNEKITLNLGSGIIKETTRGAIEQEAKKHSEEIKGVFQRLRINGIAKDRHHNDFFDRNKFIESITKTYNKTEAEACEIIDFCENKEYEKILDEILKPNTVKERLNSDVMILNAYWNRITGMEEYKRKVEEAGEGKYGKTEKEEVKKVVPLESRGTGERFIKKEDRLKSQEKKPKMKFNLDKILEYGENTAKVLGKAAKIVGYSALTLAGLTIIGLGGYKGYELYQDSKNLKKAEKIVADIYSKNGLYNQVKSLDTRVSAIEDKKSQLNTQKETNTYKEVKETRIEQKDTDEFDIYLEVGKDFQSVARKNRVFLKSNLYDMGKQETVEFTKPEYLKTFTDIFDQLPDAEIINFAGGDPKDVASYDVSSTRKILGGITKIKIEKVRNETFK